MGIDEKRGSVCIDNKAKLESGFQEMQIYYILTHAGTVLEKKEHKLCDIS